MIFGKKKPDARTLLLLDVEQGSVGATLVRLSPQEPPKLFGETRMPLKILPTRDSLSLLREIETGLKQALSQVAEVASRLRNAPQEPLRDTGVISHTAVFLGAPWGVPSLSSGNPRFVNQMRNVVEHALESALRSMTYSLYTAAGGITAGAGRILPHDTYVLVLVGAELTEMILVQDGQAVGYATAPVGRNTLSRTLKVHGAHEHEIPSLMRASMGPLSEPLVLSTRHWASELADAAAPLLPRQGLSRVWVIAHGAGEREAEWFARALTGSGEFNKLFPSGGELRALKTNHIIRHLSAHAERPDLTLSLQALYSDGLF